MKNTQLLNILINGFYYFVLAFGVIIFGTMLYLALFQNDLGLIVNETVSIMKREYVDVGPLLMKDYVRILISSMQMIFFIKTVYHLRRAALKLNNGEMFTHYVSLNLKWTGISMIVYKIIEAIKEQYVMFIYKGQMGISLDFNGFESFIFIIILGLFFMLFGNVINNARQIKQENDLTI